MVSVQPKARELAAAESPLADVAVQTEMQAHHVVVSISSVTFVHVNPPHENAVE
jgi:hypothetical protein